MVSEVNNRTFSASAIPRTRPFTLREFLAEQERVFLLSALDGATDYRKVSRSIGISLATLYRRLEKHKLPTKVLRARALAAQWAKAREMPASSTLTGPLSRVVTLDTPNRVCRKMLKTFGYRGQLGRITFFEQPSSTLEYHYCDFKRHYHKLLHHVHPDRGGSHEQMVQLNSAWSILRKRFAKACPYLEQ